MDISHYVNDIQATICRLKEVSKKGEFRGGRIHGSPLEKEMECILLVDHGPVDKGAEGRR